MSILTDGYPSIEEIKEATGWPDESPVILVKRPALRMQLQLEILLLIRRFLTERNVLDAAYVCLHAPGLLYLLWIRLIVKHWEP